MKNKKYMLTYALLALAVVTPVVSFAALDGLKDLLTSFQGILGLVKGIIVALALIFFFYGMGQFILQSGDAKLREDGKKKMIWGIAALFVIFSIYGILNFIGGLVGIAPQGIPTSSTTSSIPCGPNNPNYDYATNSC